MLRSWAGWELYRISYSNRIERECGLTYDLPKVLEKQINKDLKPTIVLVRVVSVNRDELIPVLRNGVDDIAAGALTITPERKKRVFRSFFWMKLIW